MSKITGDELAFPTSVVDSSSGASYFQYGMTLRQYYAGLAMQALCVNGGHEDLVSKAAVTYADALIKELNKEQ